MLFSRDGEKKNDTEMGFCWFSSIKTFLHFQPTQLEEPASLLPARQAGLGTVVNNGFPSPPILSYMNTYVYMF